MTVCVCVCVCVCVHVHFPPLPAPLGNLDLPVGFPRKDSYEGPANSASAVFLNDAQVYLCMKLDREDF